MEAAVAAVFARQHPAVIPLLSAGFFIAGGSVAQLVKDVIRLVEREDYADYPVDGLALMARTGLSDIDWWHPRADTGDVQGQFRAIIDANSDYPPREPLDCSGKPRPTRWFRGARHLSNASSRRPLMQLVVAPFDELAALTYFDLPPCKFGLHLVGGTPRVFATATAIRCYQLGFWTLDRSQASKAFGRRVAKYSERLPLAVLVPPGKSKTRFALPNGELSLCAYSGKLWFEPNYANRVDALDSIYSGSVTMTNKPKRDASLEAANLRSLKYGTRTYFTEYEGWENVPIVVRHIAADAVRGSFRKVRMLFPEEVYCNIVSRYVADPERLFNEDAGRAWLAEAIADYARRRLGELPPAPDVSVLFERTPLPDDIFFVDAEPPASAELPADDGDDAFGCASPLAGDRYDESDD